MLGLPARWLLRLSRRTTAPRVAAAATILPVTGYALLGGAEVATVRSLIMTLVALAAVLVGRSHSIGYGLALALVAIVAWDPLAPFDISFQLSFVSVLVIIMLMKIRRPRDEETTLGAFRERRTWEALKAGTVDVLLVSLVVTLASAPLVATYFNQLAWVGGLSNRLVVPLVGLLVLPVGLLPVGFWRPRDLAAPGTFRVTFLGVGQGDAALVETAEGRGMLIDGGAAFDSYDAGRMVIAPVLWDRGIRRLDVVVATHPQLDHVGGLAFVLRKFEVGQLWTNGVAREAVFLHRLERIVTERHVPVRAVTAADGALALGSCQAHVLNPDASEGPGAARAEGARLNNQSIVLHLACGSSPVLFTGDIESEAESRIARLSEPLKAAVLKVPHHGAKGSVYEPFLRAVNPRLAVVSVGQANAYGHPSPAMVDTYRGLGIEIGRASCRERV